MLFGQWQWTNMSFTGNKCSYNVCLYPDCFFLTSCIICNLASSKMTDDILTCHRKEIVCRRKTHIGYNKAHNWVAGAYLVWNILCHLINVFIIININIGNRSRIYAPGCVISYGYEKTKTYMISSQYQPPFLFVKKLVIKKIRFCVLYTL